MGAKRVGQIPDEPKAVISYRAPLEQRQALEQIQRSESQSGRKRTLSKVSEYIMDLGVDHYWARESFGPELDALARDEGINRRDALIEALRRGLKRGKK